MALGSDSIDRTQLQILRFSHVDDLWQLYVEQVYWHRFSNSICSLRVSESHFGSFHKISNASQQNNYKSLKAQMVVSIFSDKVLFT